jgi:Short repeat of unknown function (DUF308)
VTWRRWAARARPGAARALLVLGGVLLVAGAVAGYLNRTLLDADAFADRADDVRRDPAVSRELGEALTDAYLQRRPDAVALRPLLDTVGATIARSELLSAPTRTAARSFQRSLTQPGTDDLVLRLVDTGAVLAAVLHRMDPSGVVPDSQLSIRLARIGGQSWAARGLHVTPRLRLAAWLLPLCGLVTMVGGVALARDRRRAVLVAGLTLTAGGGCLAVALLAGSWWAGARDTDTLTGALVSAGWSAFVAPLRWSAAALALIGLLLAASAAAVLPRVGVVRLVGRARAIATARPTALVPALLRAVAVIVLGLATILRPTVVGVAVAVLIGVGLLLVGLTELAEATRPHGPQPERPPGAGTPPPTGRAGRRAGVTAGAAALAAAVGLGVLVGWGASAGPTVAGAADAVRRCNGDADLCARPFSDVTYATSHNAMSQATDRSWFIPEQGLGFGGQLDLGVRALQLDVWPGYPTAGGRVATARSAYAEARAEAERDLGAETVAAGLRVFDALTDPTPAGPEGLYLCHGLCEIGATPFVTGMAEVAGWLDANPDEVLTLIVQDHVAPGRIAAALGEAGIASLAFPPPPPGRPWPTLGQLIDSGHRVLVLLEAGDGDPRHPWLVNGYERLLQETPYAFTRPGDFTCDDHRGRPDAPLFLVNHWLTRFDRLVTAAREVNGADVLGARARTCEVQRRQPTYLAVNYADIGDLMPVVRELNGS